MKIPAQYRLPVLIAVALHVLLIIFLIVRLSATSYRAPSAYQPKPFDSIQAVAMITPDKQTPEKIQPQKMQQQEKIEKEQQQEKQEELKKAQQEKAAAKLEVEKTQALAKLQAQEKQKELDKIKQQQASKKAEQIKQQKALALKKQQQKKAKQKALLAEQKKLQQAMMQQQLNSEQKDISQIQTRAQQGQIDKYKAQILALVQSNWRIEQVNNKLKCVYSVSVAPDGEVLNVQLVKSSGDDSLDQSARQAILASSPLPVPQAPQLFSHFRQLVLTLSPQGYLQSAG